MSQEEDTARLDERDPTERTEERQFNKGDAVQYRNLEAFGVITSYYHDRTRISSDGYRYVVSWLITPPTPIAPNTFCTADALDMLPTPLQETMRRAAGDPSDITTQGALDYARNLLQSTTPAPDDTWATQRAAVELTFLHAAPPEDDDSADLIKALKPGDKIKLTDDDGNSPVHTVVATTEPDHEAKQDATPLATVAPTFEPGAQVLHVTHTNGGFLRLPGTVMSVKTADGMSQTDDGYIYGVHWWSESDPKNVTHHASQFLLPYVPEPEATPAPRDLPHRYLSDDARLIPKHCMVCGKTPDDDVHKAVDIPPAQPTYDHSTQPHPFRGQAWADWVCMVCSLRPDHSIHDDPRAGQDFDWRPSAPVLTPVSAARLLEHLRTIPPYHEGTPLNAKWEMAQQLIEDIEKGLYR